LEQLLADGKITASFYREEKKINREEKEQKIKAIRQRLNDKSITDERRAKLQEALDALEIGI
jgi:acetylglutamate kinase